MQRELCAMLDDWMRQTGDPRAAHDDDRFDRYPYFRRDSDADRYWPKWGAP